MSEQVFILTVVGLGLLAAGYLIGSFVGFQQGYWAEHPPPAHADEVLGAISRIEDAGYRPDVDDLSLVMNAAEMYADPYREDNVWAEVR